MLKRLKNIEDNFSLTKAAAIVGFLTLAAKLTALVRDPIFSSKFGGKDIVVLDIYNAAFRIPDFISNLLILGTLSAAFIPVYVELRLKDSKAARLLAATVFNAGMIIIALISLGALIGSRRLTHWLVPGFSGPNFDQTLKLTRLFLLSPIIFAASSVFTSVLNAQKKFFAAGLAPIFYNLGIIFGAVFLYDRFGLIGLGWGVILGALLHAAIQIPSAIKSGFSWQPVLDLKSRALGTMLKLYVPRMFSIDLLNISLIITTIIGSHLAAGSIAIFVFASNLQAVAAGIFGISFATAAFPVFSESFAKKDEVIFVETLYRILYQIMFFVIPITILFLLYRAYGVRLYLGHGKFTWENTIETFNTLGFLSFSIISQSITPVLTRAFFGRQNTITPVVVNILVMVANGSLGYILAPRLGVGGLALAFTIASILNTIVLFAALHHVLRKAGQLALQALVRQDKMFGIFMAKILAASACLGAVGYVTLRIINPLVNNHTFFGLLVQTGSSAALAVIAYFYASKLLKLDMAEYVLDKLKNIVKKN